MRFRLHHPPYMDRTGRGVRVAVIDSGVQAPHPHLPSVGGGVTVSIDSSGVSLHVEEGVYADRIGHGTAVAAAIHEKAPDAELWVVKVFERRLATSALVLARALELAAESGARIINLSLGTENPAHRDVLENAVKDATHKGSVVVAAFESGGVPCYPGSLPGVAAVRLDESCARDEVQVSSASQRVIFGASPFPRPIPGVPPERNLSGVSFAVANVSGFLARLAEGEESVSLELLLGRMNLGRTR